MERFHEGLGENGRTAGIFAGNYGVMGAIDLYGPAYGLPRAISQVNSYWLRGYGNPPPEPVIGVGKDSADGSHDFDFCQVSGFIKNQSNARNAETRKHPLIYVCRGVRGSREEFWEQILEFG